MKTTDTLNFVLAVLTSLAACYYFIGVFSAARRRQEEWERRLKRGGQANAIIPMSGSTRMAAGLMVGVLSLQLFAGAFHLSLALVTGASWLLPFGTMFLLFMLLHDRDRRKFMGKHRRDA